MNQQQTIHLDTIHRAFWLARRSAGDQKWAHSASYLLTRHGVEESAIITELRTLPRLLASSDEPAYELFGPPEHWARERLPQLQEDGYVSPSSPQKVTSLDTVVTALITTAAFAVLFGLLIGLFSVGGTLGLWAPFLALTLGVGTTYIPALYYSLLRRNSFLASVTMTLGAGLLYVHGTAWVISRWIPEDTAITPVQGTLTLAATTTLVAWGVHSLRHLRRYATTSRPDNQATPESDVARTGTSDADSLSRGHQPPGAGQTLANQHPEDKACLDDAAAALRQRNDHSDRRIRRILTQAQDHAYQAGTPLGQEFGDPVAYAHSLPAEPGVTSARALMLYTLIAIGLCTHAVLLIREDDLGLNWRTGFLALWAACIGILTHEALRTWWQERRPARL